MNRNIPPFRSGGLLALFLMGLGVAALQAETVKAVVESVKGTVEFAPPGSSSFSPLTKGRELAVGSTIRTGSDGTADIVTTPGSAIQVGNNSNLRLNALAFARTGSNRHRTYGAPRTDQRRRQRADRSVHAEDHRFPSANAGRRGGSSRYVLRRHGHQWQDLCQRGAG